MHHRISAGAFVEHAGRVLLVRHRKPQVYDFWVAPGGGVQGSEELSAAVQREVKEETGLLVLPERLIYVEEFYSPEVRYCKFWFAARLLGGELDVQGPDAVVEHIVEAGWHNEAEIQSLQVFPEALRSRYWSDRLAGFSGVQHLGLRQMAFW